METTVNSDIDQRFHARVFIGPESPQAGKGAGCE